VESVRAATRADLPRVAELLDAMHTELRALRGGDLWARRESQLHGTGDLARLLADPDTAHLAVGTITDVTVGFGVVRIEKLADGARLGVVTHLFVEPEARDVGVGEAMALALVAFCESRGCIGVDALALPGHRAAKNFFEEQGFVARALVMHHPIDTLDGSREPEVS
jgi:ribosomal protein S18 acetylase RimI-like enzyme